MTNIREPDRAVRVFVSSTFRDMHAERDHLVTAVFPELEERIRRIGGRLFDLDLRWGVPTVGYDGERVNSWTYCRRLLDCEKLFFVAVLGHRSGWVPSEVSVEGLDREKWAGKSITEMEIRYAALEGRGARRSAFYFRDVRVPEDSEVRREFDDDPHGHLAQLKNDIQDSDHIVRRYDCVWDEHRQRFVDLESFGRLVLEDLWSMVLRDERFVARSAWDQRLGKSVAERWHSSNEPLPPEISQAILKEDQQMPPHPLAVERAAMTEFCRDRSDGFVGRHTQLETLVDFVRGETLQTQLCMVIGPPGRGKSALLALLVTALERNGGRDDIVIPHWVGASARSANIREMLARLVYELDVARGLTPAEDLLWQDLTTLRIRLNERLSEPAAGRTVIVVDGIDSLSDPGDLSWLPHRLDPGVRIIVSCVDHASFESRDVSVPLHSLRRLKPAPKECYVEPLFRPQIREITEQFLSNYGRQLDVEELELIQNVPQAVDPLYLRVMLSELIRVGGFGARGQVRALVRDLEARRPDVVSLFESLLERLELFGEDEVADWFGYLALGRRGFSGQELSDLVTARLGVAAGLAARRIERSVRTYLSRYGECWVFSNNSFREAVKRRYAARDRSPAHAEIAAYFEHKWPESDRHALEELPFHLSQANKQGRLRELLLTYDWLRRKSELLGCGAIVSDFDYCTHEDDDLNTLRRTLSAAANIIESYPDELPSQLVGRLPRLHGSDLWQLCKCAWEEHADNWLFPVNTALARFDEAAWRTLTLGGFQRRIMVHNEDGSTTMPEFNVIKAVALTDDGQIAANAYYGSIIVWDVRRGVPMRELDAHSEDIIAIAFVPRSDLLLSASHDGDVHLWDYRRGQKLRTHHSEGMVNALDVSSDGRRAGWVQSGEAIVMAIESWKTLTSCELPGAWWKNAISVDGNRLFGATYDNQLFVRSLCPSDEMFRFPVHANAYVMRHTEVSMVALVGNGRFGITSSEPGVNTGLDDMAAFRRAATMKMLGKFMGEKSVELRLRSGDDPADVRAFSDFQRKISLWDLENGRELERIPFLGCEITCAATSKGIGRHWMVGGNIRLATYFDAVVGHRKLLGGHDRDVTAVAVTSDGAFGASGSDDTSVRIWDLSQPQGSIQAIEMCALSAGADGKTVIACTFAGVTIYDSSTGEQIEQLGKQDSAVCAVAPTSDGQYLLMGMADGKVRLWDLKSNECVWSRPGHSRPVNFVAVTSNGFFAVTTHLIAPSIPGLFRNEMDNPDFLRDSLNIPESPADEFAMNSRYFVKVWNLRTGEIAFDLGDAQRALHAAVLMADDRCLVAAAGHELLIWDIWTGKLRHRVPAHESLISGVIRHFTRNEVLSWAFDSSIARVNVESGQIERTFGERNAKDANRMTRITGRMCIGGPHSVNLFTVVGRQFEVFNLIDGSMSAFDTCHQADVNAIACSPDGRLIATVSDDHQLKMWNARTGQVLATYTADVALTHCCFLSDGSAIAAGDNQGRVHITRPAGVWAGLRAAEAATRAKNYEVALGHLQRVIELVPRARDIIRGQSAMEEGIRLMLEIAVAYRNADRLEESSDLIALANQACASMEEPAEVILRRVRYNIAKTEADHAAFFAKSDKVEQAERLLSRAMDKMSQLPVCDERDSICRRWLEGKRTVVAALARKHHPEVAREEYRRCLSISVGFTRTDRASGEYIEADSLKTRSEIFSAFASGGDIHEGWREFRETLPLLESLDDHDRHSVISAWADKIEAALVEFWESSRDNVGETLTTLCEQACASLSGDHRDTFHVALCSAHLKRWKRHFSERDSDSKVLDRVIGWLKQVGDEFERDHALNEIADEFFLAGRFDEMAPFIDEMSEQNRRRWLFSSSSLRGGNVVHTCAAIERAKAIRSEASDTARVATMTNWIVVSMTWCADQETEAYESVRATIEEAEREASLLPNESIQDVTRVCLSRGFALLAMRAAINDGAPSAAIWAQKSACWAQQLINSEYRQEGSLHAVTAWLCVAQSFVISGEIDSGYDSLAKLDRDWRQVGVAFMARAAADVGAIDDAMSLAAKAESSLPADPHPADCARGELAETWIVSGRSMLESGAYELAGDCFRKAEMLLDETTSEGGLALYMSLAESHYLLGLVGVEHHDVTRVESAINWLKSATDSAERRSKCGQLKTWLVHLKCLSGDEEGAVETADSLHEEPWTTMAACMLAVSYANSGRIEMARTLLGVAARSRGKNHDEASTELIEDQSFCAWASIAEGLVHRGSVEEASSLATGSADPYISAAIWLGMAGASAHKKCDSARRWIENAQSMLSKMKSPHQKAQAEQWIANVTDSINGVSRADDI